MTTEPPILKRICDALGITGPVSRVVIDCQIRSVCKVYVERYASGEQLVDAAKVVLKARSRLRQRAESVRVRDDETRVCQHPALGTSRFVSAGEV